MTELNSSIFDQLRREGVDENILKRTEELINQLPELEAFRRMSQKPEGDVDRPIIRLKRADEKSGAEGYYIRGNDKASILPQIVVNKDKMIRDNPGDMKAYDILSLVSLLAHEHQHHAKRAPLAEAEKDLTDLKNSPDKPRIFEAAQNYIEKKMEGELSGRLIDLRIRQDPLILEDKEKTYHSSQYFSGTRESKVFRALMISQRREDIGDDMKIIKPCIGTMLRAEEGVYLDNAMGFIQRAIPSLSTEELTQIREQAYVRHPEDPALMLDKRNPPDLFKHRTPEEARLVTQIRDCCRAPHNEGRFDRLTAEQQDNLVAALLPGAMRWAGNPDLGTKDVGRVVMTEKGFTAIEMGSRNLPGSILKTDEAIQQPVEQSQALVAQQQQSLDQQRLLDQAQGHGHGGPTLTR